MGFETFREIIDLWPTRKLMAADVRLFRRRGKPPNIRVWYLRDRIPSWWLRPVVQAAERCGYEGVTFAALSALYNARKLPARGFPKPPGD